MSQENVERDKSRPRGLERAGEPGASRSIPPGARLPPPAQTSPIRAHILAARHMNGSLLGFLELFSNAEFDVEELIDAGDLVIASTVMRGRGPRQRRRCHRCVRLSLPSCGTGLIVEGWGVTRDASPRPSKPWGWRSRRCRRRTWRSSKRLDGTSRGMGKGSRSHSVDPEFDRSRMARGAGRAGPTRTRGVRQVLARWAGAGDEFGYAVEEFIDAVTIWSSRGSRTRTARSDERLERDGHLRLYAAWTTTGRAWRVHDEQAALKAVGLAE